MDCSIEDAAVPDIFRLPLGGLCDQREWTCRKTEVYAYDVFNTDTLTCRTTKYWVSRQMEKSEKLQNEIDKNHQVLSEQRDRKELKLLNEIDKNHEVGNRISRQMEQLKDCLMWLKRTTKYWVSRQMEKSEKLLNKVDKNHRVLGEQTDGKEL